MLDAPAYRQVALDTLDFILTAMRHPEGGYIASLSAVDDRDVEGGYYLWTRTQLREALGAQGLEQAAGLWDLSGAAPFEAGYLLMPRDTAALGPTADGNTGALKARLLAERRTRGLPRDPKRIAGIVIDVDLPEGFPDDRLDAVKRVAEHCVIHGTLSHPPRVDIEFA